MTRMSNPASATPANRTDQSTDPRPNSRRSLTMRFIMTPPPTLYDRAEPVCFPISRRDGPKGSIPPDMFSNAKSRRYFHTPSSTWRHSPAPLQRHPAHDRVIRSQRIQWVRCAEVTLCRNSVCSAADMSPDWLTSKYRPGDAQACSDGPILLASGAIAWL
jgi:hypothetical protein